MWHLLLNNLKGRLTYNAIIVAAVALALTVTLVAALMTQGVQKNLEHKQRLLGPELAVVPPGTKETGHIYLTKGPPGHGFVAAAAADAIKAFPEVNALTSQRLTGTALVGDVQAMLITFDPDTDFMVLPWLAGKVEEQTRGGDNGILLGMKLEPGRKKGDTLEIDGKPHTIVGRLRDTGSFMDTTVFFPRAGSNPDGDPSWILIGLAQGTSVDMMINKLETHISAIEVIARPEMLKTINDQLHGVVQGGGLTVAATLVIAGALLVTGAMFALLVYERRREFGLLKAMGARNSFVFRLIIGEATILGGMGGLLGLLLSAVWLAFSGTGVIPDDLSALSAFGFIAARIAATIGLTMLVGIATAIFPALLAARMEPYAAIRSGS